MSKILIVDDEPKSRWFVAETLKEEGFGVLEASSLREALSTVKEEEVELVYLDLMMPEEKDGYEALRKIKEARPELPVVMLTAYNNAEAAVKAIKLGAEDYLTKDSVKDRISIVAKNILKTKKLSSEVTGLAGYLNESLAEDPIIFKSECIRKTLGLAGKAASSDITVLLMGESGTGKELLSRFIHMKSTRASQPLIAIDCAMLPENLVESELFGYERGAFTGAVGRKPGRIELAEGGTLFLDEVGNLTGDVQKKLLRFLQEKTIERIGGKETTKVDSRLITASNIDLEIAVKENKFREDLFYRLNVFTIVIPPLRDRGGDILLLAAYFAEKFAKNRRRKAPKLSESAAERLLKYSWPGNVRELRNVLERAVLLSTEEILPEHLPQGLDSAENVNILESGMGLLEVGKKAAAEYEKKYIMKVLKETNGNKTKAAKKLKIDYKTLFNKLKEYSINLLFCFVLSAGLANGAERDAFLSVDGFPYEVEGQLVYSSPVIFDIDGDGEGDIVAASTAKVYVLDKKGKLLPGWPAPVVDRCENTPFCSDIDGDAQPEIIVTAKAGPDLMNVYIFDKDGKAKCNTPWKLKGSADLGTSAAVYDLDGDGQKEIIITGTVIPVNGANTGIVYVLRKDGGSVPGWPQYVLPEGGGSQWLSTPVVSDINQDNNQELIIASVSGKVYAWQANGSPVKGWPVSAVEGDVFYVTPSIGDLDGDGKPEVVIGSCNNAQSGYLYAWKGNGEALMGFPVNLKSNIQSVAVIGDLSGNGTKQIVVGTNLGNKVWAVNSVGETYPFWPTETKGWMCNNPILADINGDKKLETVIGCRDALLYSFTHEGATVPGFPLELTKEPSLIYRTPAFIQDKEGIKYLCFAGDRKIFLWKENKGE